MKPFFNPLTEAEEISPPSRLSARVLEEIREDLRIHKPWVWIKLLFIHVLVGAATLSFCPQFNIGPVGAGISSTLHALMRLHPALCAVFCGTVFMGSSALVSVLALRVSELYWVKRQSWWIDSIFASASLACLMLAGSNAHGHYRPDFALAWWLGALGSTWLLTKLGAWLRLQSGVFSPA